MDIRIRPLPRSSNEPLSTFTINLSSIPRVNDTIKIQRLNADKVLYRSSDVAGDEDYLVESVEWTHHCLISGETVTKEPTFITLTCRMIVNDSSSKFNSSRAGN